MQHPVLLNSSQSLFDAVFINARIGATCKMFSHLFVSLLLLKIVASQINGEFWWLHEKVAQLQHVEPPAPKFEDISEFDTDESAKVVFKDNDINPEEFKKDRNMSLNEGEILPGFVHFNLAQPVAVEREVLINKTKTMNKTHEDYKINFVSAKKEPINTDNQVYLAKGKNDTKNQKISINGVMQPDVIYYKLTKPVSDEGQALIDHNNKLYFSNHEDNIKQFIPSLKKVSQQDNKTQKNGDEFRFTFPNNDEYFWDEKIKPIEEENADKIGNVTDVKNDINNNETLNNVIKPDKTRHSGKIAISDKIEFDEDKKQTESESICTFITKHECIRNKGIIHMTGLCSKNSIHDYHKICCILPLFRNIGSKMAHLNRNNHVKRYKRSDPVEKINSALQQRNALLQKKSSSNSHKTVHASTTVRNNPAQKIVTPDYVDPYWNIKNSKFRHQTPQSSANTDYENAKYDYGKDYAEDYTVEVPRPGLVGFYSDQERLTSWKMKNKAYSYDGYDEVSEEDSGESDTPFGYSSFDPRQGERKKTTTSRTTKRKPQRLIATTEEDTGKGSASQTINFHSKPDFHVLQGFKLVNLMENKNRFVRKTTTESICDNNQENNYHIYSDVENPDDIYDDSIDLDQQIYNNCGKSLTKSFEKSEEPSNDPWLALVVLTKSPQTILCYATIVHPRAAITAAECVHGKIPGDVSILTGLLNLKKDKEESQHRMASVHVNSDFKPGDLANDLALLYWKRPFRLEASVQPACLADPHVGDDCYFVGWGGYDQALQHRPNSQQATILTPRTCNEKLSAPEVDLPAGAFCASVASRGTVTGIGGPLLCKGGSRVSIVGVAVYRENVVILLPAFEWIVSALRTHHIV